MLGVELLSEDAHASICGAAPALDLYGYATAETYLSDNLMQKINKLLNSHKQNVQFMEIKCSNHTSCTFSDDREYGDFKSPLMLPRISKSEVTVFFVSTLFGLIS
jgi:hypothetical protein